MTGTWVFATSKKATPPLPVGRETDVSPQCGGEGCGHVVPVDLRKAMVIAGILRSRSASPLDLLLLNPLSDR
jgi:hypothetical protein